uniref:Regulator of telomere elongation helicase 1 n=1 Tax=Arundo donax TaxID=35708 RepID=A0A0A9CN47_ARUDO
MQYLFLMKHIIWRVYVQMQPLLTYIRIISLLVSRKLMNASNCVQQRGPLKILLINNLTLKIMQSSKLF